VAGQLGYRVCMFVGVIPVTVRPPQAQNISTTLPTVHMIVEVSKAAAVLTTSFVIRLLRSKVRCAVVSGRQWCIAFV